MATQEAGVEVVPGALKPLPASPKPKRGNKAGTKDSNDDHADYEPDTSTASKAELAKARRNAQAAARDTNKDHNQRLP